MLVDVCFVSLVIWFDDPLLVVFGSFIFNFIFHFSFVLAVFFAVFFAVLVAFALSCLRVSSLGDLPSAQ